MRIVADFHIHSKYSRATSKDMDVETLDRYARIKGINLLGTGDFTHPQYFAELQGALEPLGNGLFKLREKKSPVHFILTVEVSNIFSVNGRVKRVHILIFAPSFEVAEKINEGLSRRGKLASDGRPIFGAHVKDTVKLVLDISPDCLLVPAHVWTPWFSVFGSRSGFDSLEECFEEETKNIYAIETGLSSDPPMNWRLSLLDRLTLISNSDAHSPSRIGREANVLDCGMDYAEIVDTLKSNDPKRFLYTLEFFPEEGKYHWDGHRNCKVVINPESLRQTDHLCPRCHKPLTLGVLHRVNKLADRPAGHTPPNRIPFKSMVALDEIIAEALNRKSCTQTVRKEYESMIRRLGPELEILFDRTEEELNAKTIPRIADGIMKVRRGEVRTEPGYDGVYGKVKILWVLLSFFFMSASTLLAGEKPYDYLIQNALIFDGVSSRGFRGDVATSGDSIAEVGFLDAEKAKNLIDGTGLVLSPGFIDAHTHSDFNAFIYPGLDNKLRQGVTTEIVGNCGMSAAPVRGEHKDKIHEVWAREGVEIPAKIPWEEFKGYHSALEAKGLKTNLAALVGHGNLRMAVMGPAPRAATANEIKAMKKLLVKAMKQGAYGISYGLVYLPGIFAQEEELVELCRQAAAYSGVCAFHMRNEGSKLIEAVREALSIAEKSGGRIQISHLKAGGEENWGKIQEVFQLIEDARRRGVEVEADAYPYAAGFAELGVVLPDDIYQREDRNDFFEDRLQRANLIQDLETYYREKDKDWDKVVIATTPVAAYRSYQGKSLKALAEEKNQTPVEVLVDLLAETSFQVSAFYFSQSEEVVDQVLRKPYVDVGSDSIADGSPGPHPRAFGTFPKIVKKYVREKRDLEMGEAIRKMTSVPAEHFGLKYRGRIQPGYAADLVLFDPQALSDNATYALPNAPSQGVKWVFVNGQPAIENGKMTFKQNGQVLLRHG